MGSQQPAAGWNDHSEHPWIGYSQAADYSYFQTILHEFFHILGFFSYVFENFPVKPSTNPYSTVWTTTNAMTRMTVMNGSSVVSLPALNLTSVVQFAQSHYACPSLLAVPLEDEGQNGTVLNHWKKLFVGDEIMNPTTDNRMVISNLSLLVLQETGWYNISTGSEQDWYFGQGEGCGLFNYCPPITAEYCTEKETIQPLCTHDFQGLAYCSSPGTYFQGCYEALSTTKYCDVSFSYEIPELNNQETLGMTSSCFQTTVNGLSIENPECLAASCQNAILTVSSRDGLSANCTASGELVALGNSQVRCPDVEAICAKLANRCPSACEKDGNGVCLTGGNCYCFFGESFGSCHKARLNGMTLPVSLFMSSILLLSIY